METMLAEQLGHPIQSFEIRKIDYVRDLVELAVVYELPGTDKPQFAANVPLEPSFDLAPDNPDRLA